MSRRSYVLRCIELNIYIILYYTFIFKLPHPPDAHGAARGPPRPPRGMDLTTLKTIRNPKHLTTLRGIKNVMLTLRSGVNVWMLYLQSRKRRGGGRDASKH